MQRLEIKSTFSVDDTGMVEGLAWPFGTPDRVGDIIEPGAFANARLPMPMLFGHDPNDPVGAWTEAAETPEGLRLKGRLLVADVARAREVHVMLKAGVVRGLSIGFAIKDSSPRVGTRGRNIRGVELVECSLVTIPAHPGARVTSVKSASTMHQLAEALSRAAAALRSH